jgi:preprotein translocase subunit Sec63
VAVTDQSSDSPTHRDSPTHYELLQIGPDASAQDLRQAFRRLSKRYHPDTTDLPQRQAEEAFRRLQQAYLTLGDPARRRLYDAALQAQRDAASPSPAVRLRPPQPLPVRRALSGGEWFALLLLALAVVFSLVLGVGLAWARGAALFTAPSWWAATQQTAVVLDLPSADARPAAPPDAPLQPSPAGPGAVAG